MEKEIDEAGKMKSKKSYLKNLNALVSEKNEHKAAENIIQIWRVSLPNSMII